MTGPHPYLNLIAAGATELLAARAMALMLCCSDYEATGFLDEAAGRLATAELLDECVDHALDHAGRLFLTPSVYCALAVDEVPAVAQFHWGKGRAEIDSSWFSHGVLRAKSVAHVPERIISMITTLSSIG